MLAAIWCLAAFVLSQAYNSTLITYVIALVEKNMGMDVVISRARRTRMASLDVYETESTTIPPLVVLLKFIASKVFCQVDRVCLLLDAMFVDFQKTGQCRLQIAKEGFMNFIISFALAKHSPK